MAELSPTEVGLLSILLTLVVAAGAIACGICAAKYAGKNESSKGTKPVWLSSISTFAGGVLLAAALTHLLNDTVRDEALDNLSATIGVAAAGLSLSLHSIVAGVALGASNDVIVQYDLLLAVLAHKGLAAFSLTLLATRLNAAARNALLSVFVSSTPVGIAIGLGVSAAAADSSTVVPLIISFAAGTIAYTGAFEIILPELGPGHGGGASGDSEGGHSHELLMLAAFSSQPLEAFQLPGLSARTRRREAHMQAQYGSGKQARALSMDSVMMEGHFPQEYTSPALPKRSYTNSTYAPTAADPRSGRGAEELDLGSMALLGHAPGSPLQAAKSGRGSLRGSPLALSSSAPAAPPSPLVLRASQSALAPLVRDRTGHSGSSGGGSGSGSLNGGHEGADVETGNTQTRSSKDTDAASRRVAGDSAGPAGADSGLCALAAKVASMVAGFVCMSVLAIWA